MARGARLQSLQDPEVLAEIERRVAKHCAEVERKQHYAEAAAVAVAAAAAAAARPSEHAPAAESTSASQHESSAASLAQLEAELQGAMVELESLRVEQMRNLTLLRDQDQTISALVDQTMLGHDVGSLTTSHSFPPETEDATRKFSTTLGGPKPHDGAAARPWFKEQVSVQLERWSEIGGQLMERLADVTAALKHQHQQHGLLLRQLVDGGSRDIFVDGKHVGVSSPPHPSPPLHSEAEPFIGRDGSEDKAALGFEALHAVLILLRRHNSAARMPAVDGASSSGSASLTREVAYAELKAIVGAIRRELPALMPTPVVGSGDGGLWLTAAKQMELQEVVTELVRETKEANRRFEYQRTFVAKTLSESPRAPTKSS
eukprot:SAG11_NODE_1872_length_4150_cov_3.248087_2_plen_374_part_00